MCQKRCAIAGEGGPSRCCRRSAGAARSCQRRGDEEAKAVEEEDDQQAAGKQAQRAEQSQVSQVKSAQVKSRERAGTGRPTKPGQAQEIAEEAVTRGKDAAAQERGSSDPVGEAQMPPARPHPASKHGNRHPPDLRSLTLLRTTYLRSLTLAPTASP